MAKGTVTRFNPNTGYGFIEDHETGESVFVYQADIDMDGFRVLNPGDIVEYNKVENDKGFKAENVKVTRSNRPYNDHSHHDRGGYDRAPQRRRTHHDGHGHRGGRQGDPRIPKLQNIIYRLLDVLGDSIDDEDPLLSQDEIDFIKTGVEAKEADKATA